MENLKFECWITKSRTAKPVMQQGTGGRNNSKTEEQNKYHKVEIIHARVRKNGHQQGIKKEKL